MKKTTCFFKLNVFIAALFFSTTVFAQYDYTSRIVNSSFELNNLGETHTTGVYRVIVPYGWSANHNFAINSGTEPGVVYLGNNSQGLNNDTYNRDGNFGYWFSGTNVIPEFVEFSQQIGTEGDYLPAGTYKVACRMTIVTPKITTQRLFANNVVQYFGTSNDYDQNLTAGESNSFAGHAVDAGNPGTFKDMEVIVNLDGNTPLKLGIRTGSVLKDGTIAAASNPAFGWFKMDYFRLVKLAETAADATLSDLKVNGTTIAGFDPLVQEYTVVVPAGSTPAITATTTQTEATHQIVGNTVVVTAQNTVATKTYTINFVYSYTAGWDGSGATGVGSEPYNFGWRAFMGTTDMGAVPYTVAGSGYMRYMDNYSDYGAGRRLMFLRWDTQVSYGSLDGTIVHSYPMTLEANKTYKVTFDYAGQNNGAISIRAGINTQRDNSGTSLISEVYSCVYRVWNGAELIFTPTESREYYLTVAKESGEEIIFSLSKLLTTDHNATTTEIKTTENSNKRIYLNADQKIVISGTGFAPNTAFVVYNSAGQKIVSSIISGQHTVLNKSLNAGVYIVKVGNYMQKVLVQ